VCTRTYCSPHGEGWDLMVTADSLELGLLVAAPLRARASRRHGHALRGGLVVVPGSPIEPQKNIRTRSRSKRCDKRSGSNLN
jgi:hypothetical protein